jgi:hypothetical protein
MSGGAELGPEILCVAEEGDDRRVCPGAHARARARVGGARLQLLHPIAAELRKRALDLTAQGRRGERGRIGPRGAGEQ